MAYKDWPHHCSPVFIMSETHSGLAAGGGLVLPCPTRPGEGGVSRLQAQVHPLASLQPVNAGELCAGGFP